MSSELAAAVLAQNQEEALLESWLSAGDRRALNVVQAHSGRPPQRGFVSQRDFDEAVRENVDEFEMAVDEAEADARATFSMQGMRVPDGMRYGAETGGKEDREGDATNASASADAVDTKEGGAHRGVPTTDA